MGYFGCKNFVRFLVLLSVLALPTCWGFTDISDVYALNSLYTALGSPPLAGWLLIGGHPCGLAWQGVECVNANVTGILLNGANLGGVLSTDLASFTSMIRIYLSDNHVGGIIPTGLPATISRLSLSGNQFTGGIPDTVSMLGQLIDLIMDDNHLTGAIPDVFQQLNALITLNLSGNSLDGQLPPSMGNLISLTRFFLQDNQLSGTLDVLQDIPLIDLNIENNLFSGSIAEKLLSIPNFSKAGNPFNTSILPSPPASSPSPSPSWASSPELAPVQQAPGPSVHQSPQTGSGGTTKTSEPSKTTSRIVIAGIVVVVVLALAVCIFYCHDAANRGKWQRKNSRHAKHMLIAATEQPARMITHCKSLIIKQPKGSH